MYIQYDAVGVEAIPASAPGVAFYVDGSWPTAQFAGRWPNAKHVFIAVHASENADFLDVENGDATIDDVAPWLQRQFARKIVGWRPGVYSQLSNIEAIYGRIEAAGISLADVRVWSAHVTNSPHLCGPQCGFGLTHTVNATQWTWTALGRTLDESLLDDLFYTPTVPPVPPKPKDPHHYYWFTDAVRREHVMTYDELRRHPLKNRKELKRLREQLNHGAHSVALGVINRAKISGKSRDWSHDRAGWRYQQLIKRANGKRVVK